MNMKKGILLAAAILLSAAGFTQAQEGELSGTLDVTLMSSHIWRGFDVYANNHAGYQASVDLDFYGTGFGVKVLHGRAFQSGFENTEELNLTLYYGNNLFEGEAYATNYTVGWVYYNYPDQPVRVAHMQEAFASLALPELCPFGVVPSYTIVCWWPAKSGSTVSGNGGWLHVMGLGYDMAVPGLLPEIPEQNLHLSAELVYNGGSAPGLAGPVAVDHDWSHAQIGVSTDFDLAENVALTPALYHQLSMENTVNNEDEWWATLGVSYKF
jgi:hypothetical protein